jgi:hypothetical protein
MWDLLQQQSFLLGTTLVLIYQAAKFNQLNRADPLTNGYVDLLPGAQVKDFAGSCQYYFGLAAFLIASFVAYFLFCHFSPDLLKGAGRLANIPNADNLMQGVPYPLYIAALFMGLNQPIIPGLAQFGEAQRDFFHDRIYVPRRIIDLSERVLGDIDARTNGDKQQLSAELRKLVCPDFAKRLQEYADFTYYRNQIEKLGLENGSLDRTIDESSAKEIRMLIKRLVLCALVAGMRGSGAGSLSKVSELLGATHSVVPPGRFRAFLTSVLASGLIFFLGLLVVAHILVWLAGPVSEIFHKDHPDQSFWPTAIYAGGDESSVGDELLQIAFPMAVCLVMATWLMPRRRLEDRGLGEGSNRSLLAEFLIFFQSGASVFFLCVVVAVAIKTGQLLTEYSSPSVSKGVRSPSTWLILAVIQSFIAVAVCFFTTWYLASSHRKATRPGLSLAGSLLAIAGVIGPIAFLYDPMALEEYLRSHPKFGTLSEHWEHVLFSVIANVLVSLCAFGSIAVFDKARQTLRQHTGPAAGGVNYQPAT